MINLPEVTASGKRYMSVDYRGYAKRYITEQLIKAVDNAWDKKIVKYQINRQVEEEENRNTEFKEIKGNNPCDTIVATAEIYIVAFLNSRVSGVVRLSGESMTAALWLGSNCQEKRKMPYDGKSQSV